MARASRSAVLALISLAVAVAPTSCGSGSRAPSSAPALPSETDSPGTGQIESNWYKASSATIAESDWGRVRASDGLLAVMLGPNADYRRRHELKFARVLFTAARVAVADDQRGTNLVPLEGQPSVGCLFHAQGAGVNVIIATRRCVPIWATTANRKHARMWIRVQNLGPHPKIVYLQYAAPSAVAAGATRPRGAAGTASRKVSAVPKT